MVNKVRIIQKLAVLVDGKVLAIKRSLTDKSRPSTWDLVGGNVDNEDVVDSKEDLLIAALKREVVEEVGLNLGENEIKICYIDSGFHPEGYLVVWIGYCCIVESSPKIALSNEHSEYKWVTKQEFLGLDFGYAQKSLNGQIKAIDF